jgi:hypothetical protein
MANFWMGIAAANAAAKVKPSTPAHRILSILAGVALALLIGAGLFIVAALTN